MKLASALTERSQLQDRIQQLGSRLNNNALVQEGEQPAEDPQELLAELEGDYQRLETLIARINQTNVATCVEGRSLCQLLAERDCLLGRQRVMRSFLDAASNLVTRRTVGEIKIKSTVNVSQLQKQVDKQAKALRELDDRIQEANWTTELP